jgi:uncharacterized protein (TIRG00374 family)
MNTQHVVKRGLKRAIGGLLILSLLAIATVRLLGDPDKVRALWQKTDLGGLVFATLVISCAVFFMALRWRALFSKADAERAPLLGLSAVLCTGLLLNIALPGPVGELAAAAMVQQRYGVAASSALAATVLARFIGLGTAALVAGLCWWQGDLTLSPHTQTSMGVILVVILAGALTLWVMALRPDWMGRISTHVLGRFQRWPRLAQPASKLSALTNHFATALSDLGRPDARHLIATFWSIMGHLCVGAGVWCGALALGQSPSLVSIYFVYATVTAGSVVLFALPGGQLGWDAALFTLFVAVAGLPPEAAAMLTLLVRTQQSAVLCTGAMVLAFWTRSSPAFQPATSP